MAYMPRLPAAPYQGVSQYGEHSFATLVSIGKLTMRLLSVEESFILWANCGAHAEYAYYWVSVISDRASLSAQRPE